MYDDSQDDLFHSDPTFEAGQRLPYDDGALAQTLTEHSKDWGFECRAIEPNVWKLTRSGEASRFVLLRRDPNWHVEAHGFAPKVADGKTFAVRRSDLLLLGPGSSRVLRGQMVAELIVEKFATRVWPRLVPRRERPRHRPRRR